MAVIISLVASKGGVGKTTVSAVLGDEFAKTGKTAVLDCDCDQYSIEGIGKAELVNFDYVKVEDSDDLMNAINHLKREYDYIICDTAPHSHTEKFFLDILKTSDAVIGVTQPAPTDILAFHKIMLNILKTAHDFNPKQKQLLLINRVENIASDIQKQSLELIDNLLADGISKLNTVFHNRAAFKAHGYFAEDPKKDKKKIEEVQTLVDELRTMEVI